MITYVDSNSKVFYVYVLLKTYKPGKYTYNNLEFEFEPFYVGKGHKFKNYDRIEVSKKCGNNNFKMNIINKHNKLNLDVTAFKYKDLLTNNEAIELEKELIEIIGKSNLNKGPLCNLYDGESGKHGPNFKTRKRVFQYNKMGFFIKEYNSIKEAVLESGISNISRACNSNSTAGEFVWRKEIDGFSTSQIDTSFLNTKIHSGNLKRKVALIDLNNDIIKKYNSIKDAMEDTDCHKSKIVAVCKNKISKTKNKRFKYL